MHMSFVSFGVGRVYKVPLGYGYIQYNNIANANIVYEKHKQNNNDMYNIILVLCQFLFLLLCVRCFLSA